MPPITLNQALEIVGRAAVPLASQQVSLIGASGRVLAAPVIATFDSPRSDVSMMDGYAVRADEARSEGVFDVIGTLAAGARFDGAVGVGQAVRIFTGAALPTGADQVVIQENVTLDGDRMTIAEAPGAARFVRARGSDFGTDEIVVAAGIRLTPGALVAAAGAGADRVDVVRRPRVITLATGNELRALGEAFGTDRIPDSIGPGLTAMLDAMGAEVIGHLVFGDDLATLQAAAEDAVARADLVVVTGGASVGARDHAKAMFAPLGMELLFSKVKIKPGKPVWLGRVGATLVMGLPGNPGSALVTARLLLAPLVAGMLGQKTPPPLVWINLPLGAPIPATGDRETFLRATLIDGRLMPVTNQDSGAQRVLGEASWLIRCPAGQGALAEGTLVPALAL